MLKPDCDGGEYARGYRQASIDFGIAQLLSNIRSYSDSDFDAARARLNEQELESLAVFSIQRVAANLKGSTLARYLKTLRKANSPIVAKCPETEIKSNQRSQTVEKSVEKSNESNPWTIVRILPNAQHYTVARFFNRQDAEDFLRALYRFIPVGNFEIVFDRPYCQDTDD